MLAENEFSVRITTSLLYSSSNLCLLTEFTLKFIGRLTMDWNKRNELLSFYKTYMEYLSKAQNKLTEEEHRQLREPLLLSPFEKAAVISILKETISKISVVNLGFDGKNSIVELPPSKPPMHIRFKEPIIDRLYNEETLEPLRECFKAMSISKLQTDIEVIRCAVGICYKDLQESGRFRKFADFILCENREAYDEFNLLKTYCENTEKMEELQKEQKRNRQINEDLLKKLDDDLFCLQTECEEKEKTNRLEVNMVKKWENARQEQVDAVYNHELKKLHQERDDYEEKTEKELIAINEIMAFYRTKCAKLEESIELWQQRYETERKDLDEQIKHTEETIEDVISKHEHIRSCFEKRERFIEEYYIEQKELEEIRKIEEGQHAAAVRIQAWWRGTMVRRQLGPYRPKKKSKKPKAGKKK